MLLTRPIFTLLAQCLLIEASLRLVTHDGEFVPDHVLRVSTRNISVACETRQSAVVNGTSPGPELRIPSGQRTWIRVYNDLEQANLTMVCRKHAENKFTVRANSKTQALAWACPAHGDIC